jgi:LPPG:FO 2-phospho-L-lactate transferase
LAFQDYFVRHRCAPVVAGISFDGAAHARMTPALKEALADPSVGAIVICPSNPYLSIDPMLALPGMRGALTRARAPVVAVSPLIGGLAVKGPAAKIMGELGVAPRPHAIAAHYRDFLKGLVIDEADAADASDTGVPTLATRTLMASAADKVRLAAEVLAFAATLRDTPALADAESRGG